MLVASRDNEPRESSPRLVAHRGNALDLKSHADRSLVRASGALNATFLIEGLGVNWHR